MERETPIGETEYYELLEVSPAASSEVIDAAYQALAGKEDGLKDARTNAHAVLMDNEARQRYDRELVDSFFGRDKIGNYRLQTLISENGFSRTYKAEHLETGMPVWIMQAKKLSPRSTLILKEEVVKLWDLRHYSLPVIRDFFSLPDGQYVVVMSAIKGKTIHDLVTNYAVIEPNMVGWIIDRCLNVCLYLHTHAAIHGAINPYNLMLQYDHAAVLTNSNLIGAVPELLRADDFSRAFMPPEQIRGEKLWPESDFYSLGATMIFALTGDMEMVKALKLPDSVPKPMRDFVRSLTKKDAAYRPRWEDSKENKLIEQFRAVRIESFGSDRSNMEPIPGLSE